MKKLATAITALALIGTPALAADMAVKAPPPPPAPVYSWTGWYAGLNAGASFGDVKTDFNEPVAVTATIFGGGFAGTGTGTIAFAGSDRTYPDGFMGGGQIGYNYQLSPIWVVGLEADIQGAIEKDSNTSTNSANLIFRVGPVATAETTVTSVLDYQTKIDWFGTVRGRIGYVWGNGKVLSYVTGGLAYGKVDVEGTSTVSNAALLIPPYPSLRSLSG